MKVVSRNGTGGKVSWPSSRWGLSYLAAVSTLEIRSPSNVAIEYAIAPLTERAVAFLIDLALVALLSYLFYVTIGGVLIAFIGQDDFLMLFLVGVMPLVMLIGYWALWEYYFEGQTLGKYTMGLRTVRVDGEAPSFETFAIRATMLMVDFALTAGTLGLLSAASSADTQRTGDRIAQTVVVRSRLRNLYQLRDLLNIKTVDDHEVHYPRAAELDIDQALAIKELLVRCDRTPTDGVRDLVVPTSDRLAEVIGVEEVPPRRLEFLRQVLRDYIVLTR